MRKVSVGIYVSEEDGTDYQCEGYELNVPNLVSAGEVLSVLERRLRAQEVDIEKEIRGERES